MAFIRHPKDFWAGLLFIALGGGAFLIALDYAMGTAGRMGPGYFPRSLGGLLAALGLFLVIRSLRIDGERIAFPTFKPLVIILASVLVFGLTLNYVGLVIATIVLVVTSSFASHEFGWRSAIISSALLAVFVVIAFRYGLKIQIPTWPPLITG